MSKVETSFKVLDQFSNSSTKIPYIVVDNFPQLGFFLGGIGPDSYV